MDNPQTTSVMKDPCIQRTFKGHKDTITNCVFNPNMYFNN
jgi:hypothetical protein